MKLWKFETNRANNVATAQPQSPKSVFYFDFTWWPEASCIKNNYLGKTQI